MATQPDFRKKLILEKKYSKIELCVLPLWCYFFLHKYHCFPQFCNGRP